MVPVSLQGSIVSRETIRPTRSVEEWVIWTYQDQQAHKVEDRLALVGRPMGHASRCSVARVAEAAALGAIIHGTGRSAALHPDAELVHDTVRSSELDDVERGLILEFGETAMVPDWMPDAKPCFRPVRKPNGKPAMILDRNDNVIACRVEEAVTAEEIRHRRWCYTRWWFAMAKLACLLRIEGLASCTDPMAKQEPWALQVVAGERNET